MILPVPAELISQMALDLKAHLARRGITEPRYIGIRTGGIWVAQALLKALNSEAPLGTVISTAACATSGVKPVPATVPKRSVSVPDPVGLAAVAKGGVVSVWALASVVTSSE